MTWVATYDENDEPRCVFGGVIDKLTDNELVIYSRRKNARMEMFIDPPMDKNMIQGFDWKMEWEDD